MYVAVIDCPWSDSPSGVRMDCGQQKFIWLFYREYQISRFEGTSEYDNIEVVRFTTILLLSIPFNLWDKTGTILPAIAFTLILRLSFFKLRWHLNYQARKIDFSYRNILEYKARSKGRARGATPRTRPLDRALYSRIFLFENVILHACLWDRIGSKSSGL